MGNILLKESKPFAHAHIVVSDKKGEAMGGHVMPGCIIGTTGELVLIGAAGGALASEIGQEDAVVLMVH